MSKRRVLLLAALLGGAAWYWFRPERALFDVTINEPLSGTGPPPVLLARGRFHPVAHEGSGTATVFRMGDGRRLLRLSDFRTSNGPDVHVYLVAAPDATDDETVERAGFVPLGPLKGNVGNQHYELPASADLTRYRAVTIWCRRFGVNFTTAPLVVETK